MKRPIIIIFTGHVGSSWLTSLLGNHKSIKQVGFEPIDQFVLENIDAAPVLESLIKNRGVSQFPQLIKDILSNEYLGTVENEIYPVKNEHDWLSARYIVFKTRLYLEKQRSLFIDLLPRVSPIIILLCRRNKIKSALSQFKRTQLKISHLGGFHETEKKRRPIVVEPAYILTQAKSFVKRELITKYYFDCLKRFTSSAYYEIFYEDLLSADWRSKFFEDFFAELGLENNTIESNYRKMTPDDLQDAVVNFTELSDVLNCTVFQPSIQNDEFNIVDEIYTQKLKLPGIDTELIRANVEAMFRASKDV